MATFDLPEKFDDLPNKRQYWPAPADSPEEGLGMLRILTPEIVANAARTQIQTGERVCLNWGLENLNPPGFGRKPFEHKVKWVAEGVAFDDEYHFNPQQGSQWDGFRHHNGPAPTAEDPDRKLFHGGTTAAEIQDADNDRIGIGYWAKKGIAGRGVLIDFVSWAEKRGVAINALTQQAVSLDTVLEIARECNITFQRGDIFFLRIGLPQTWDAMNEDQRKAYSQQSTPKHAGIEQSERVLRFFWDNHFAAVASDAVSFEVFPPLKPEFDLHHHMLAGWGVPIGEMFDLDGLAGVCTELGRWTFFVSSSPLNYIMVSSLNAENARAILSPLISWRTLAFLLALLNLKTLPLVWHVRLFRHFLTNIRWRPDYPFFPKPKALPTSSTKPSTHPVFTPYSITTRTPLLETDYNLHKSNSTYFTDLDVSRTALVTRLYSPGVGIISKELDAELAATAKNEGKKAPPPRKSIYIALGAVYCSFKREIKPYELFEVESRVLGWDQKWMYILSFFLRPAAAGGKGGGRVLYATAVSKYVVKKGRLTVAPERVLRRSGFLPERPEGGSTSADSEAEAAHVSGTGTPAGITAAASGVDGSIVREVMRLQDGDIPESGKLEGERKANEASWDEGWSWERIEEERLRGMKVLEGLCTLDSKLFEEWEE
ncbi:hypothetical protein BDW59DRAFT_170938 [Aspergillus cavernicola]|uniref:Capsule polysaccharide biosynthesis protein n=1 Tax=Aspergillus cavernicola TaxID=176166 RepID=A0ABR4IKZ1_9EURO